MKHAALLLILIAAPVFAQEGGTEPTYTTEPVTQQVPHCAEGQKLMQFDPAFSYAIYATSGTYLGTTNREEHGDRWIPAGDKPTDTLTLAGPKYRCFDEKPVLHRRDEGAKVTNLWGTTVTASGGLFQAVSGLMYSFPEGTKCIDDGKQVTCQMPSN